MRHQQKKDQKKRFWTKKNALIIGISGAIAIVLALAFAFIYRTVIDPGAAFALPTPGSADISADTAATPQPQPDYSFMEGRVNILVMGMDSNAQRLGTEREDFRTDTMLLVTINFDTGKVDMITTPRDSYVTVTKATGDLYKVNSAAYFGGGLCDSGFMNACDTISGVFGGIPVNYYVGVNMDGLEALIDAMGGVDYDVDITFQGTSGTIEEGWQHMNSEQVLDYLRVRKGYGTDVDRQERQRRMLISIFRELADTGQISNLPEIYQSLKDMVYTNLSFEQICALAVFAARFNDWDDIGQYTLKGEYHTAYGVYYYLIDQQAKADLVRQIFGADIGIDETHDLYYVLNDGKESSSKKTNDKTDEPEPTVSAEPSETSSVSLPDPEDSSGVSQTDKPAEPSAGPTGEEPSGTADEEPAEETPTTTS